MDEKGVYAVARSLWDSEVFQRQTYTQREAWLWLIGAACWKDKRINVEGRWLSLVRGEFTYSLRFLAKKWKWSTSKVVRFMSLLKNEYMIRDTSRDEAKVYLILKYNDFQVVGLPKRDTERDTKRDADETPTTQPRHKEETLETLEDKKVSKEPATPSPPKIVSMLPDWMPLQAWSAYLEMRRKQHKVATPHAIDLLIGKLERWRTSGHDPTEILNYSTMNSYTGLFEPKAENGRGQQKRHTGHDNHFAGTASLIRDLLNPDEAGAGEGSDAFGPLGRPLLSP